MLAALDEPFLLSLETTSVVGLQTQEENNACCRVAITFPMCHESRKVFLTNLRHSGRIFVSTSVHVHALTHISVSI